MVPVTGICFVVAGILGALGVYEQIAWVLVAIAGVFMLSPLVIRAQ